MAKVHALQNSWNAGEISPLLYNRIDFDKRNAGSKTLENFVPTKQGPITARAGTLYVGNAKDGATKRSELIPFEFSTEQAYMIEMSEYVFRFYKDGALASKADVTGVTSDAASPVVFTKVSHGLTENDIVTCSGFTEQTGVNGNSYAVKNVAANTFELHSIDGDVQAANGDFNGGTPETTGGTVAWVGSMHVYSESDMFTGNTFNIDYTQSADTLFMCHGSYAPHRLVRNGDTSWDFDVWHDENIYNDQVTLGTITPQKILVGGPIIFGNPGYSLTFGAGSGTINAGGTYGLTASSDTFTSDWVGRHIMRGNTGTARAWMVITDYTSATSVTVYCYQNGASAPNKGTSASFSLGLYSNATSWPTKVTFFQDRFVLAGCSTAPQRIDFSDSSLYKNFDQAAAPLDDDSISLDLAATKVNRIRWMRDTEKGLLVGTTGGEWLVKASGAGDFITPSNAQATRPTGYGSSEVRPSKVGTSVVYTQRSQRKVRKLDYAFSKDGFNSEDLTTLAEHITEGKLSRMAYQEEPWSVVWFALENGKLLGMTYDPDQDVTAWHRHTIGGSFGTGDAVVESIAVIPAVDEDRDELWMIVKRTIGGSTVRHVEYMNKDWLWDRSQDQKLAYQLDAGVTVNNPLVITAVDNTSTSKIVEVTSTDHGLSNGNKICVFDIAGMTELNNNKYYVTNKAANTFELADAVTIIDVKDVTKANPGNVETFGDHGLSTGDKVTFFNIGGMTEINGVVYTITKVDDTNFTIGVDTSGGGYTTYTSGGECHQMVDGDAYTAYDSGGNAYLALTQITGLAHLEGESVSVLADGASHADKTVGVAGGFTAGTITLDRDACVAHAGYGYTPKWISLEYEAGGQDGPALSKTKRINRVNVYFDESLGGYIGHDSDNLDEIDFRIPGDEMDQSVPFYSGYKEMNFNGDYAKGNSTITFEQQQPFPVTIVSVHPQLETQDRG